MLSEKQGEFIVRLARRAAEDFVKRSKGSYEIHERWLLEKLGVFTTIETYPKHELRGCIGLPLPVMELGKAVIESARSACSDPRFDEIKEKELEKIVIEVSVLTKPEKIDFNNAEELIKKLIPKKDGLILECGSCSGLFLPQVWEKLPEKEQFLDNLCLKADLAPGSWRMSNAKISRFRCQVFKEQKPNGRVFEG
jgi:hypothetical protein